MTKKFCLCGCGCELLGKQRRYASEACRKRYERNKTSGLSANLSGFVRVDRESSGNRPGFTNKRAFAVTFTIVFVGNSKPGEWDLGLMDVSVRAEMAQIIQNYLEYMHPGWKIRVKIESKPQFTAF
jgi:hypothetical protein